MYRNASANLPAARWGEVEKELNVQHSIRLRRIELKKLRNQKRDRHTECASHFEKVSCLLSPDEYIRRCHPSQGSNNRTVILPSGHFVQPLQGCKSFADFTTGSGLRPSPAAIIVMTPSGSGEIKLCEWLLNLQVLKIMVDFFMRLFYNLRYSHLVWVKHWEVDFYGITL